VSDDQIFVCRPYLDIIFDDIAYLIHIRPMESAITDILIQTGDQIRKRRHIMGLTQAKAAARAGVAYRTWRRMEKNGSASIEDLIRSAIALRCEQGLCLLFPEPAAHSMDDLLKRQRVAEMDQRRKVRKARL
jgi:transcriptional regulator with XRE-family HTH domain